MSTKMGLTLFELQNKLPKARVTYTSANAATESGNIAYMGRLGLCSQSTPYKSEEYHFEKKIDKLINFFYCRIRGIHR